MILWSLKFGVNLNFDYPIMAALWRDIALCTRLIYSSVPPSNLTRFPFVTWYTILDVSFTNDTSCEARTKAPSYSLRASPSALIAPKSRLFVGSSRISKLGLHSEKIEK